MEFTRKTLPAQPYLYVDCSCPMDGTAIAEAMGAGFGQIFAFTSEHGITPQSMPIAVYPSMPSGEMRFHCGVIVSKQDAAKATEPVQSGVLPAGDAMTVTHIGPYNTLSKTHGALWKHMEEEDIEGAMPIWEVYVDDPGDTPPETLRTEIFRATAPKS